MDIVVHIQDGLIVVDQPRDRIRETFSEEEDAVALIAERVVADAAPVEFAASCEHPRDNGRPGFSKTLFVDSLQDAIYELQAASRPRAA